MNEFELTDLNSVSPEKLLGVLSNPKISKHLPLFDSNIDLQWVKNWVVVKTSQWQDSRLGPYAVTQNGEVIGWAGYQPDGEVAELAIVLSPSAWGIGHAVVDEVNRLWNLYGDGRQRVFYLPISRNLELISQKLGYRIIGKTTHSGHEFSIFEIQEQ